MVVHKFLSVVIVVFPFTLRQLSLGRLDVRFLRIYCESIDLLFNVYSLHEPINKEASCY